MPKGHTAGSRLGCPSVALWCRRRALLSDAERGQRALARVARLAARLAGEGKALQARDLALAFGARRVVLGQAGDQARDAVAQLQGEVRGGGAHQLAHVLDADLAVALGKQAAGILGLAHGWAFGVVWGEGAGSEAARGEISSIASSSGWVVAGMARSSPMSQP